MFFSQSNALPIGNFFSPFSYLRPAVSYLLDTYPAAAAYSLRKLSSSHNLAIRVRRASDSLEQDIGFVGDDLDEAAIIGFCGASNGFVSKIYDAGINAIDCFNTSISAQPKIYDGVTGVIKRNNKPYMSFSGSQILVSNSYDPSTFPSNYSSAFCNIYISNDDSYTYVDTGGGSDSWFRFAGSSGYIGLFVKPRIDLWPPSPRPFNRHLIETFEVTPTNYFNYQDSVLINTFSGAKTYNVGSYISIGGYFPVRNRDMSGDIGEIIIFSNDINSYRDVVHNNMNNYWSVY